MLTNEKHLAELNSPVQTIHARVELHNGSTLAQICTCQDFLSDFTVERVGEGKFFGFGICHKLLVKFIDIDRQLNLTNIDFIEVTFGVNGEFIYPFPTFYISEVNRDETTNEISVVAYDKLFDLGTYRVKDLELPSSYSLLYFASACAALLGISLTFKNVTDFSLWQMEYPTGANFEGTETVRDALNALAEATQTVYYIDGDWRLTFKRLDKDGDPALTINKNQYIDLQSGNDCVLGAICHATELGDNITANSPVAGVTQYLRDNAFLDLRDDVGAILDKGIAAVGGFTINPFECFWIGNYLLEIGDKIGIIAEDDGEIFTYIIDDSISFDGTLSETSRWNFENNDAETAENPTSLGDALKQTYARVDKANKRIDLVVSDVEGQNRKLSSMEITLDGIETDVSETVEKVDGLTTRVETAETNISQNKDAIELRATKTEVETVDGKVTANTNAISAIQINAESISTSVQTLREETETALGNTNEKVSTVTKEFSDFKQTSTNALLEFQNTVTEDGVTKLDTKTGFLFDKTGLHVSNSEESEITTTITHDGMHVYKNNEAVLTANNKGVDAVDLHATTYLIIGGRSRFENYGNGRTACFWIGS